MASHLGRMVELACIALPRFPRAKHHLSTAACGARVRCRRCGTGHWAQYWAGGL